MGTVKMKRQILIISLILLFIPVLAKAADLSYKEGELLVRFADPAASTQTKNNILNLALGCSCSPVVKEYSIVPGLTLAKIPASMTVEQARVLLTQSSNILYAEPNFKFKLFVTPNDTRFSELWGMNNTGQSGGTIDADIDAPEAWNMNTGSRSVIVAVTDLGVDYTHPDLSANMWVNTGEIPGNGVDDDGNGYIDDVYGYDTGDNDGDPMDDSLDAGHGTHVAGTIGAVGNNARGVTGVCWNVRIMAVKIADSDGVIFLDAILEGIQYAIDNGAKVINASWGTNPGYPFVTSLYDIINVAKNHGILFVAAAGNDYSNNNDTLPVWPASYNLDNIISVMATDNTDGMSYYSNYGPASVDISAPGGAQYYENDPRGILSTLPGNDYGFYQGTSMASPHVAGACALLLSADPGLTYIEVKQFLLDYSDRLSSLTGLCVSGGRLNLFNSLSEVLYDFTPPSPNPAEWEIVPQATGLHTIAMEAKKATDRSGVEYSFQCSYSSKNSGWQSNPLYSLSDCNANTTYTFTVKYRDKSDNHNETGPSTAKSATTANGSDNLPPFPNPSRWEIKPKVIRLRPTPKIRMSARTSTDETSPVLYYFKCTSVNPAVPDPNIFSSTDWNDSGIHEISSGLTEGSTYTFRVRAKDGNGNVTADMNNSQQASVTVSAQGANILTVPVPYPTIQSAINASSNGDFVEVRPGTYTGIGNRDLDFWGKAITVRSIDPNDPSVVAATIINCAGDSAINSHRAFNFQRGEDLNSIVTGFTITNGWMQGINGPNGVGLGDQGQAGQDVNGGAIRCYGSSPTIRNCVIIGCVALGGNGGDGAIGNARDPTTDPPEPSRDGGKGGNGGSAKGGGIYCDSTSNPLIDNCEIRGCYAIGGVGGDGGNGGDAHRGDPNDPNNPHTPPTAGGNGGNGGSGYGGGIYFATNNHAIISNCKIINNDTAMGQVGGVGGQGGNGLGLFPNAHDGANGANGNAQGGGAYYGFISIGNMSNTDVNNNRAVVVTDWNGAIINPIFTTIAGSQGGGIYCSNNSIITLTGCSINDNEALGGDGGGIWYQYSGTLTLNNCTVSGNRVPEYGFGGGISAGSTAFPLTTTVIIDNKSTISGNEGGLGGGGMLMVETNLTLDDSTINDNNAFEGGGALAYNCIADVNNMTVMENSAAELGGGFSIVNGLATINNSYLTGNSARGSVAGGGTGGALFFEGWSDYPHQVTNCLITDNSAFSEGGGLSNNTGSWVQVNNCTFASNKATAINGVGGAISCAAYWAYVEIFNSILWDNTAISGGSQIAVGDPDGSPPYADGPYADVDASFSDVQGGEEGVWLEDETQTYTAFWWLIGNIDENPWFASTKAHEQTYFLSQKAAGQLVNSPCVDAGNGSAIPGTTRTDYVADSNTVDMGYHYPILAVTKYFLTLEVINQGYGTFGTVEANLPPWMPPGTYDINQGRVVELHAEPNAGWEAYKWTETDYVPVYPADPNYNTVTMNSNKTVTVEFGPRNAYKLVTHVIGNGTIEPAGLTIWPPGSVVSLTATPDNPSEVVIWTGTDDDFSDLHNNTVTMNSHREVTAEFYAPRTLYVPAGYPTIQAAIDDSHNRDIIEISSATEPYYTQLGFYISGRAITITSTNPDDPCCVAHTIIQTDYNTPATGVGPIFNFNNVGRNTILNGLTIRGYNAWGGPGGNGLQCGDAGGNGPPISGGGISCGYVDYMGLGNASPTIKNCIIADCSILGGDGGNGFAGCAEHRAGGEGGWPGRAYGAAAACFNNSSPIFINCTFRNNIATGGLGGNGGNGNAAIPGPWGPGGPGGGWYYGEGNRWYNHNWPYGPYDLYTEYTGRGGAVYVGSGCSPEFIDCTFTNNRSTGGSNGICGLDGSPVSARYEPSIHYNIDNFGGAVFVAKNSTASFVGCTFNNNLADTDTLPASSDLFVSFGGAIAFEEGADLIVEDCNFNGNLATIGGGIYSSNSDLTINNSGFTLNSAFHGGGALFVGGTLSIDESRFSENEAIALAGQGGGVCCLGANAGITNCDIFNNGANGSGGGIYISNKDIYGTELPNEHTVLVKNCLITGNSASRDGGGISANWHCDPDIVNCTIADNVVTGIGFDASYGGGLYGSYGSYINIINSIIWGNVGNIGTQGSQLAVGTSFEYNPMPSTVNITYSDVQDATNPNAFGRRIEALDLVFCIDSTGSMADDIAAVKDAAYEITAAVSTQIPDSRIAVVEYKDFNTLPYGGPNDFPYKTVLVFSTDTSEVVSALDSITASGGADGPESVYAALMHCIDHTSLATALAGDLHGANPASVGPGAWRSGNVLRVIILMGDAEPHDPEPFTNYTSADIIAAATGIEPKRIVPLLIGGDANAAASFSNLAAETGGTVLQAATAEEVVDALLAAIELISQIPDPVLVDPTCTLNWNSSSYSWYPNSHNIDKDPRFVSGYYLSQIAAGQTVNSDCVDAGSDTAAHLGLDEYTTRTDGVFDEDIVDMGYHYLFGSWIEACKYCELFHDGTINFRDFALFVLNWLSEDCSSDNDWCNHADVTFDSYVNFEDLLVFTHCWLFEDTDPPLPNPSQWVVAPYSSPGLMSITMTAETTVDNWGGLVEYYFDCVSIGGHDSGWQIDPNYTDTGLVIGTEYGYKVRARDAGGNLTGWSPVRYAEVSTAPQDSNPPTPNPMTWATAPYATSSTSIAMVATTAVDDTAGVEYYFEDYDIPAVNSGWRSSPTWQDTTCEPLTTYRYRVRARDTSPWHNQTGWSTVASATTPEEGGGPDTNPPAPVAWEIPPFETGGGLNAYANMTAAEATDPEGNGPVEYYFECADVPSLNSGWMTERVWNNVYIGPAGQYLLFHFRVRDSLGNTSAWSTSLPCY